MTDTDKDKPVYTCNEYRAEMILLALERRLVQNGLSDSERQSIREEIGRLKAEMGMG
ncbi:MAG: hypothetical protein KGY42_05635 [Desulfobacterales bacterium]|nr:hypothetical protein [Desulfobacterales bacterium]MBS3756499.1 hypothetical protein [Desulfobacterales bacterium]